MATKLKRFHLDMTKDVKGGIEFTRDHTRAKTKANAIKIFSKRHKTKVKVRDVF